MRWHRRLFTCWAPRLKGRRCWLAPGERKSIPSAIIPPIPPTIRNPTISGWTYSFVGTWNEYSVRFNNGCSNARGNKYEHQPNIAHHSKTVADHLDRHLL